MKTGDIAKHFGISDTTIRRWVREFEPYFSDSAKRTESRQRTFTGDDFLTLATINQLSKENLPLAEIQKRLQDGYRVEDTTAQTVGYEDGRLIPAAAVEQLIDSTEIKAELEAIRLDHTRLLAETIRKDETINALQQRIAQLERALGVAEGRLQEIEKPTKTPRRWWGG